MLLLALVVTEQRHFDGSLTYSLGKTYAALVSWKVLPSSASDNSTSSIVTTHSSSYLAKEGVVLTELVTEREVIV